MSWTLSIQASVLPLPYRTTYPYIYKYIFIMLNQLSGSVGESQPLTLPGNYRRSIQDFRVHSESIQDFRVSSDSIGDPFRFHSQFQGPFRFHSGSFTISGSVQVLFGIHSNSFRISEFIQDPFGISGSIQDPFRVHAASPLPYHLPIGLYENRFQTFSTYPYIYKYIFIM